MGSSIRLLLFLSLDIFVIRSLAQAPCNSALDFCWACSTNRSYSNGSTYAQNLNSLFSSLSSQPTQNQADSGFYNSSLGEGLDDRVNAIAMCRGDVGLGDCGSCLKKHTTYLLDTCLYLREATLWAPKCMIRYSDNLISGVEIDDPRAYLANPNNVTNEYVQEYEKVRDSVLQYLSERAASGDSQLKFASRHELASGGYQIYALVQCTPDLEKQNCSSCLKKAMSDIPGHIGPRNGGRVLTPSCTLQYEGGIFYNDTSSDSVVNTSSPISPPTIAETPPLVPAAKGKKSKTKKVVVIIIVGVLAFVTMLFTGLCIYLKVKQQRENHGISEDLENDDDTEKFSFEDSLQYDFEIIRSATDDFSDANKLGQGGFGAVYKGMLLNGQHIAVKRLAKNSAQGASEFKNEVMLLVQLQHRNLVRLLGYCLKGEERLLVYEFMPNTSLDHFLFDPINHGHLDWETRYKIISGIVRGLLYLHEDSRLRIIHRDLKAGNVLLGEDMNPKIADFGMARSFVMDQTQGNTKIIVGTYGYMAPEYVMHGRFSVKSDIFSFGVLVLEIVTGRKVGSFRNDDEDLLSYAWRSWRSDTIPNIIDPMLAIGSRSEMMRCIHIGLLCVQENVNDRPTMASIASMFNSHSMALSVPLKPAYYSYYNTDSDISEPAQRSVYNESRNEVSNITEPCPR